MCVNQRTCGNVCYVMQNRECGFLGRFLVWKMPFKTNSPGPLTEFPFDRSLETCTMELNIRDEIENLYVCHNDSGFELDHVEVTSRLARKRNPNFQARTQKNFFVPRDT